MQTFDPLFLVELSISHRHGQPTVKFYMQHYAMLHYRMIPKTMHLYVQWVRERYQEALKKRLIGVVPKVAVYISKP
jgi:hypothetical protein